MIVFIIFLIAAGVQIAFLLYAFVIIARCNRFQVIKNGLPASIIVAAHNEHDNLTRLIPALQNQNLTDIEIIIALDRCTDGSNELIKQFQKNDKRIKPIEITEIPDGFNPKKFALNQAIEHAENEVLIFTDADCIPSSEHWASNITGNFSNSDVQLSIGFSPYLKKPGLLNGFIQFETMKTAMQYLVFTLAGHPYMAVGRNLAYKKSFFKEVKGFKNSQHITGGDDDLLINQYGVASNTRVHIGPDSVTYSYPKEDFTAYFRQKLRHLSVGKYYKSFDKFILTLLGTSEIMFWVTFIILAAAETNLGIILGIVISRWILLMLSFSKLSRLIGNQFEIVTVPLLDMVFSIYLLVMAPAGFFTRKVRWT